MPKNRIQALVVTGSALWCLAIISGPILGQPAVYEFFSLICHQQSARSWHVFGAQLPVCIRCASIYFGFFAAILFSLRPSYAGLRLAVIATLTEFVIAHLFLDSALFRSVTGLALGATMAPFVRIGIEEMLHKRQWKQGEFRASV